MKQLISLIPILLGSFIYIGIGIYAIKKKTPMHFWAGTTVKSEEITDIEAYNKANGIMWIVFGIAFFISYFFGSIFFILTVIFGLIIMMIVYKKIYDKYRVKEN
ncbi:MAG: hypothetical protein ACOWWH_05070 [Eubacteriaceae bacterium]